MLRNSSTLPVVLKRGQHIGEVRLATIENSPTHIPDTSLFQLVDDIPEARQYHLENRPPVPGESWPIKAFHGSKFRTWTIIILMTWQRKKKHLRFVFCLWKICIKHQSIDFRLGCCLPRESLYHFAPHSPYHTYMIYIFSIPLPVEDLMNTANVRNTG